MKQTEKKDREHKIKTIETVRASHRWMISSATHHPIQLK